jgi:hypothetical protein
MLAVGSETRFTGPVEQAAAARAHAAKAIALMAVDRNFQRCIARSTKFAGPQY